MLKGTMAATALLWASAAFAQVTADQLAKPPADAQRYVILSKAGTHGHTATWIMPDGTRMERDTLNLRGQVFELEEADRIGKDGMLTSLAVRGFTPQGDAAETFSVSNSTATWKSQVDAGSAAYSSPAMYVAAGGGFVLGTRALVDALLASPTHSVTLLPGGKASIERLTKTEIGQGPAHKTVVCWGVSGLGLSLSPFWTTEDGELFGAIGALSSLPEGREADLDALTKAQDDALAARSPALAHALLKAPPGPVAFTHVRAFVDGTRFVDDETVLVNGGVITAVGPAASVQVPANAQRIDGAGKTLVPGLWDSHQHLRDDSSGPLLLSLGITSARDPGNDDTLTIARRDRRATGALLSPHVYPSSLIDGKGPYTAQVANVATSLDEAVALVRRAKANGFTGIKFYGSVDPAWVAPAAAEAHRLGLHVHGHLPAGMRPSQAIADGYDEITHIYFVAMEAMPDDVVKGSNSIARMEGPAEYAKDMRIDAEPMKSLIALMARKQIVSDPTLVVVESLIVPDNGDLSPAYAPYVGTLPPAIERGFRQGGLAVAQGYTRTDYRKSFQRILELVRGMHEAGVPIVAGTDGYGLELVRELELYVRAGLTPEAALASATIVPAHNVGVDKTTGSIAVGKTADLVLVSGDPSHDIGDLRNTRVVMLAGGLMDADALRTASGISGPPHPAR
jgi:imidazolonepropionase-like amidohydrolase